MSELSILNCLEYPNWDRDKDIIQNLVYTTKSTQSAVNDLDTSEKTRQQIIDTISELEENIKDIEAKKNELITITISELNSRNSQLNLNEDIFRDWIDTNEWKVRNPKKIIKLIIYHTVDKNTTVAESATNEFIQGLEIFYSPESDMNDYLLGSNSTNYKTEINLESNEYLTGIEIISNTDTTSNGSCRQITLYTNFNGSAPKIRIPTNQLKITNSIVYIPEMEMNNVFWHFFNARINQMNLASPKNEEDFNKIGEVMKTNDIRYAWTGIMTEKLYNDLNNVVYENLKERLRLANRKIEGSDEETRLASGARWLYRDPTDEIVNDLNAMHSIDVKNLTEYGYTLGSKWLSSTGVEILTNDLLDSNNPRTSRWGFYYQPTYKGPSIFVVNSNYNSTNNSKIWNIRGTYKFPAIYEKTISSNKNTEFTNGEQQILSINKLNELNVNKENIYQIDTFGKISSETTYSAIENIRLENQLTILDVEKIYADYTEQQNEIDKRINELRDQLKLIDNLHDIGDDALDFSEDLQFEYLTQFGAETFTNLRNNDKNKNFIENIFKNILKSFNNIMPGKLIEGNANNDRFHLGVNSVFDATDNTAGEMLTYMDNLRDRETKKHVGELLIKRNNLFTNTVMDYMIHNDRGTDVNKVYNKVKQKNINTNRQVGINMYYSKMYKEYINIIKVIIVACALVIPVLILNSNYIIPKNITIFLVTVLIVFLVGFIIYKIYDLNYRDYKNFDKIKIPYDREAERMIKEGKLDEFENPLLGNLTCIADSCCDVSMVYDSERNKCVMEDKIVENFLGENFNNKESFINRNYFKCDIVQDLLSTSLASSTPIDMNNNLIKQGLDIEFSG